MAKDADKFLQKVQRLKGSERQLENEMKSAEQEAHALMNQTLFALMKELVKDDSLSAKIKLEKNKKRHEWVFNIVFREGDMINRPDAKEALTNVREIAKATGLESPIVNEMGLSDVKRVN